MTSEQTSRRFLFPVLGLGLLALVLPGTHLQSATRTTGQSDSSLGYRSLWLNNPAEASRLLVSAVRQDPASPERWADLADAFVEGDYRVEARYCIDKAVAASPGMPHIRMRVANLSFRMGDPGRGVRESAAALVGGTEYEPAVFQAWARLGGGAKAVFQDANPSATMARSYLKWLLALDRPDDAAEVWQQVVKRGFAAAAETLAYSDYLISKGDYAGALSVSDTLRSTDGNLVRNGGFEDGGEESIAGWNVEKLEGTRATRDAEGSHEGGASLRIRFARTNPFYGHVTQKIAVGPGTYRLTAYMKTAGITSEQGISIRLRDVEKDGFAVSKPLSKDHDWQLVETSIHIGSGVRLLEVAVFRRVSWDFDAPLEGTVWVDDMRLTRVDGNS